MSDCNHQCGNCSVSDCAERSPASFRVEANHFSHIKKVIAVVSGKGGVGKSMTTAILAVNAARSGKKVAIIDADITGPSIPKIFGLTGMAKSDGTDIFPVSTATGIKTMSLNLLTEDPSAPVVWRGPILAGLLKQFWTDVAYGEIDELYIDMPPGTGDVPLTVYQSLPVDGIVLVTSPQELVSLIVEKAVKMAKMMDIPMIGIVENYSYMNCPCCGEKIYPYGKGNEELASRYEIPIFERLPIDPKLASSCDEGKIEEYEGPYLTALSEAIHNSKGRE